MVLMTNTCSGSIKYLGLQHFYTEIPYGSNHYPYKDQLVREVILASLAKTQDETNNGYFATANYLDSSIKPSLIT